MLRTNSDGESYDYRGYFYKNKDPKKNQITGEAMFFIEEFIKKSGELGKMKDDRLTEKENEVMSMLSMGLDRKEISERLNIAYATVASRIDSIYQKYSITNSKSPRILAVLEFLKATKQLNKEFKNE